MTDPRSARRVTQTFMAALILLVVAAGAAAQESGAKQQNELASTEKSLADQFDRLELLAGRLAELSKATQPRRAELLQQLVAQSREKDVPGRFEEIVAALEKDDLGTAATGQTSLHADLRAMLELLLQEDRDRQLESERQRIAKYLADLNKIIRQQRGIRARTEGGDSEQQLGEDQQRAADNTQELGDKIEASELTPKQSSERTEQSQSGESQKSPHDGKSSEPEKSDKGSSPQNGEQKPSEGSEPQGSQQESGKPSDSQGGESKKNQFQPSESQPGEPPSAGSEQQPEQQPQQQTPSERAVEKLRQAQQRMQRAQEKLNDAKRNEAVEQQEQALRELEQAKAELEKILRQLREEEMERMLVLLEARLRKMLEMQNEVYDETIKLAESTGHVPEHELEIACASLGRKEDQIVGEADRALVLMQEDGSSVAFPEALQQAREDMRTVVDRLRDVKTDEVTQALEKDIIATLEETLAALQQALKELRDKKASQQQGQSGEPGEQPLVDQLAELRMIRAMQARINRRTEFYDELIEGDQTREAELLEALRELAVRQERIFDATRDLHQGTNQ
jgi:murein DD-endopeptidase MepM/ murein hydrolase activator NlpD